jgi:hypothetical protein
VFVVAITAIAYADSNRVVDVTFLQSTKVRVGVPAQLPDQLLSDLSIAFTERKEISLAKISLAQFIPPGASPFFSYVVGVSVTGDAASAISFVTEKVKASRPLPIPVVVVDLNQSPQLFTAECPQFFTRKE